MFSAAMAGVLLLFNFCATNPVTGKKDIVLMSEEQEIALGAQSDPAVLAQFGLYEDKSLQQFIQQKGQAMAAVSHRPGLKYEFKVVDSPVINAFALPGGYVYFTRGIMAHFNNEAQFAGVLGHEIGHITARHSVQQQSKSTLAQLGLITGMIISPEIAQLGNELSQGLGLLFLKFGRDDERESDELGVEYSTKIGYDASQMADFFQTLQRQQESSGQMIPDFLSTHPNPADRYATVHKLADTWKKKENLTNAKVGRDSYLNLIDGIVYGEDPRQGFVENSVFYHPELKFRFPVPSGWAHHNSPQVFQMAPQDGSAMMNLMLVPGDNLETAAQTLLKNFNLEPVESKSVTVNGLPAIAVVADQKQEQQVIRTLTYIIRYGNYNYSLMGITTANNFNNYFQTFTNTMQNFAELTEADKLNRKPERIRIITVPQSATLSQVLQNNNIKQDRLEEFAVLNGMQLSDRLEKGTLVKVVSH